MGGGSERIIGGGGEIRIGGPRGHPKVYKSTPLLEELGQLAVSEDVGCGTSAFELKKRDISVICSFWGGGLCIEEIVLATLLAENQPPQSETRRSEW